MAVMSQSEVTTPKTRRRTWPHRGSIFALISLVVFALTTAVIIRGLLALDHIEWGSGERVVTEGQIRASGIAFGADASRGAVRFTFVHTDWSVNPTSSQRWLTQYFRPSATLIIGQSPFDRENVELAGFQWVRRVIPNRPRNIVDQQLYALILPLWPLLIASAIPPWLWWRRRRKLGARGFPVGAVAEPGGSSGVE